MCFILDLLPKYIFKKCFFGSFSRNTELCAFPITSPLCFDVIYPECLKDLSPLLSNFFIEKFPQHLMPSFVPATVQHHLTDPPCLSFLLGPLRLSNLAAFSSSWLTDALKALSLPLLWQRASSPLGLGRMVDRIFKYQLLLCFYLCGSTKTFFIEKLEWVESV